MTLLNPSPLASYRSPNFSLPFSILPILPKMSDYEKLRQKKLEENKRKIEELKLTHLSASLRESSVKPSPTKVGKRKAVSRELKFVALRRSTRVANLPQAANYKEEPQYFVLERRRSGRSAKRRGLDDRVYASNESREYATEKAYKVMDDLDSKFPSFVKPMTQSHVTGGFWLGLPKEFCCKHLPRKDTYMTLVDEDGNDSKTLYLALKNGLSAGWRGFSIDHELVDGDAVVFQLVNPTKFKVYIVRASEFYEA